MNQNKEFYDKLVALTGHTHQELEGLHKLRTEYKEETGEDIRNMDTMEVMLKSLQTLSVSIDTIAKMIIKNIETEE